MFVADEAARDRYDERTLATLIAALRAGDATVDEKLVDLPTGEDQFVVRGYEHLLLVRLSVGDDAEVLVTLERDAEVDVNGFVDACRRRLRN
ncbi:hypothetical protein GJ632_15710 [Halogeometricum sp. CBA1124]|nr:hypothetical protein [Halogeometricum sp. CBA1124]